MALPDLSRAVWRKSSHSQSGNCVEVAFVGPAVAVRDSKNPACAPGLVFARSAFVALLTGLKSGAGTGGRS